MLITTSLNTLKITFPIIIYFFKLDNYTVIIEQVAWYLNQKN